MDLFSLPHDVLYFRLLLPAKSRRKRFRSSVIFSGFDLYVPQVFSFSIQQIKEQQILSMTGFFLFRFMMRRLHLELS